MLMKQIARKNWTGKHCGLRSGFLLGALAALALPASLYAQSPLTVQPSTGRVGVGTIAPSEKLDVDGNVKATRFIGDGSQLTNLPIQNADVQVFTTPGANTWTKAGQRQDRLSVCHWRRSGRWFRTAWRY